MICEDFIYLLSVFFISIEKLRGMTIPEIGFRPQIVPFVHIAL